MFRWSLRCLVLSSWAPLSERAIIRVEGPEAGVFMQNIFTNDVRKLCPFLPSLCEEDEQQGSDAKCLQGSTGTGSEGKRGIYGCFLNSKGRVLFDAFLVAVEQPLGEISEEASEAILVDVHRDDLDTALEHLDEYNLEDLSIEIDESVEACWSSSGVAKRDSNSSSEPSTGTDTTTADGEKENSEVVVPSFVDPRPPIATQGISRMYRKVNTTDNGNSTTPGEENPELAEDRYQLLLASQGVGEGPRVFSSGKTLPFECNVDLMEGISFRKGCYLGQELTHRTHVMLVTRKRLLPISYKCSSDEQEGKSVSSSSLIPAGSDILKGTASIGKVACAFGGSVGGQSFALGVVRLQHLEIDDLCCSVNLSATTATSSTGSTGSEEGAAARTAISIVGHASVPQWWPDEEKEKVRGLIRGKKDRQPQE